jgi:hypothetical protein
MTADVSFDRALAAVADGRRVDWSAVERLARDEGERERVRCLRLLGEIGELHRTTVDPLAEPPAEPERPPAERKATHRSMTDTLDGASGPTNAPRWGRYHLVEKVGTGGFGQVYRAWDPELERELAIKILHAHIADGGSRDRLRHEGRALARIRQTNVVNVLGVEVHEGRAALCMEFVRGQTLDDLVHTRGTFSAREAALIGEDVCRALSAVHRAGYLHRDVKAKNVMREQAGRIVLMDFGTGREEQPAGRAPIADMTGTPLYMAPEVLAGRPASMRSDVYSVGVLLFYLVSRAYPVQARGTSELKAAHRDGRRRLLSETRSDLPAAFVRVIDRALAPKPEERYASAAALLEALGDVLAIDEPEPVSWRVKWARRLAVGVPATLLAVVALGALTSVAFNNTLDRVGFASETLWDQTRFGLKSCLLPMVFLLLGATALAALQAIRRVLVGVSTRAQALDARIQTTLAPLRRDPAALAAGVLLVSAGALLAGWWYFWPLIDAMSDKASTRPLSELAILSPAFESFHNAYRQGFSWMIVATFAAWCAVVSLAARARVTLARNVVMGGVVVLCLQMASLTIAYRLLIHNKFEPVSWRGQTCYQIGARADQWLLFCPTSAPPRSRAVARDEVRFDHPRALVSVFTGIERASDPPAPNRPQH